MNALLLHHLVEEDLLHHLVEDLLHHLVEEDAVGLGELPDP